MDSPLGLGRVPLAQLDLVVAMSPLVSPSPQPELITSCMGVLLGLLQRGLSPLGLLNASRLLC